MKAMKSGKIIPGGGLEFSDERTADYLLEKLGGKTSLQQNYPAVYQAFINTRKKHNDYWVKNSRQGDGESFGLHSFLHIIQTRK